LFVCWQCQRLPNRQKSATKAIARRGQLRKANRSAETMIAIESAARMKDASAGEKGARATSENAMRVVVQIAHAMPTGHETATGHAIPTDDEMPTAHAMRLVRVIPIARAARSVLAGLTRGAT
jgi:hypothetical protein